MDRDVPIIAELQRINVSLTQSLCHFQDLTAKLNRQLYYAREDLQKSDALIGILEWKLQRLELEQQQQPPPQHSIPAPNTGLCQQPQQQDVLPPPHALFGNFPTDHTKPIAYSDIEHRTAGTLLSPSKKGRRPLTALNDDNAPLKMSDLPKQVICRKKRAPLNSPPAKQTQKKASNLPTPQKIAAMRVHKEQRTNISSKTQGLLDVEQAKKQPIMTLVELRKLKWGESEEVPNAAACRPLLTAIHRLTDGNVAILKASLYWLAENVPLCRSIQKAANEEAANIVANIESWLEHNLGDRRGTLPMDIEQALQAICSAVLFNKTKNMNVQEVLRVLPSIGGRKRLTRTKALNLRMISDNRHFFSLERKIRKDAMWPLLCLFVRRKICWNDKYTKVDTNYSRKIKCKEPQIEAMEGGGFRLTAWKIVEREMRMWYEETKLSDVLKLVLNSAEWKELKAEYPAVSLGRNSLRLALCPSVRKPSFRSCVNEKMSALSYLLEDFYHIVNTNEILQERINNCQCQRHRAARDMIAMGCEPPTLWHKELRCLPSRFCGMATCPKEQQPHLRVGDKVPPKLRAKHCTKSICPRCGFAKKMGLGEQECKVFEECNELMEVTLWEKAARNGDRFQREPTRYTGADSKTVAEVYKILIGEVAPAALEHLGEAQWWHAHVERKVATFSQQELLIYTDFSATPELVAKEVGNCHEAEHCVIDVLVVLDDPRTVKVVKDGETIDKRINSCTYWAFLGPTDGKGKKNDHRFHREALNSVVNYHKQKALDRSVEIDTTTLLTDNCGGQFKSQYNMGDAAWFAETHPGIRLEHCYATVFEFKGVHDGFGKTVKWKFKEAELKGRRIANAQAGYRYLLEQYVGRRSDWDILEQEVSPKLLQRGAFTMTEARVGYVADTKEEVLSVQQSIGGDHILYCDRDSVPRTVGDKAAEGLSDIYSMRGRRTSIRSEGSRQFWDLELASRVCFCSVCTARDSLAQKCPYDSLREVRQITVFDKASDDDWCLDQRAKRAVAVHFRKRKETGYVNMEQMRDELRRIERPFPPNARRRELAHIFLSIQQEISTTSDQQDVLLAVEDEIQFPENPSLDDDYRGDANEQELPMSEEEAPTDIEQLAMNDISEEGVGNDYSISDQELKTMTDFAVFSDSVLLLLLAQRRLSTTGSRAEREERLEKAVRPF